MKNIFTIFTCLILIGQSVLAGNNHKSNDPIIHNALTLVNQDSLSSWIQQLQDFETRFMLHPNRKEIAEWIHDRFISFGLTDVRIDSFLSSTYYFITPDYMLDTTTWQYNVEARLHGQAFPEKEMLVMAYYDAVVPGDDVFTNAPGANTNASGVAAMLESARILSQLDYNPRYSMVFVATAARGQGFGYTGASDHAYRAVADGRDIMMVLYNERLGYDNNDWMVNLTFGQNAERLKHLYLQVIQDYTSLNYHISQSNPSMPFWFVYDELWHFVSKGFPGVYVKGSFNSPYYQSVDDIIDYVDFDFLAENTRLNLGVMLFADLIAVDAGITGVYNLPEKNCSGFISPKLYIYNHGIDEITEMDIVCMVNGESLVNYTWEGSLSSNHATLIQLPEMEFALLNQNTFVLNLNNINGVVDQLPANNTLQKNFTVAETVPKDMALTIRLDENPHETSWEVKNGSGVTIYSGGPYQTPYEIIYLSLHFEEIGCYQLVVYDEGGDGLKYPGIFVLHHDNSHQHLTGTEIGYVSSLHFEVVETLSIYDGNEKVKLLTYPNPVDDWLTIEHNIMAINGSYHILNSFGTAVKSGKISCSPMRVNIGELPSGMYFLMLRDDETTINRKLIKQ